MVRKYERILELIKLNEIDGKIHVDKLKYILMRERIYTGAKRFGNSIRILKKKGLIDVDSNWNIIVEEKPKGYWDTKKVSKRVWVSSFKKPKKKKNRKTVSFKSDSGRKVSFYADVTEPKKKKLKKVRKDEFRIR